MCVRVWSVGLYVLAMCVLAQWASAVWFPLSLQFSGVYSLQSGHVAVWRAGKWKGGVMHWVTKEEVLLKLDQSDTGSLGWGVPLILLSSAYVPTSWLTADQRFNLDWHFIILLRLWKA